MSWHGFRPCMRRGDEDGKIEGLVTDGALTIWHDTCIVAGPYWTVSFEPCGIAPHTPERSIFPGSMIEEDYKILSVQPTEAPLDMDGNDWHCYIIAQGNNTIRGYQQGNIRSVTTTVEEIVVRLNERRMGKRGRVHLDMSVRGKPAKT